MKFALRVGKYAKNRHTHNLQAFRIEEELRSSKNLEVTRYEEYSSNRCPAKKAIPYR